MPKSKNLNDVHDDLWNSIQQGNHQSFRMFYMEFTDILYNYGRKISSNEELVKDSIHDVFQLLWEKKENISINTSLKHYVLTTFKRDLIRKIKKSNHIDSYFDDQGFELSIESKIIGDEAQIRKMKMLDEAIKQLSNRQKEILFLKYHENLSYKEISELMDLNKNSMYKLLSSAIGRLREFMASVLICVFAYY